jgi:threonine dehydrogenase-like Zn-dependent dehydrogenase
LRYGYAAVGDVIEVGEGVARGWIGRTVFSFHPHASAFVVAAIDAWAVPEGMDPERAVLMANMETAVNLVLDGAPRIDERVAVFGQGVVGLLTTALLARFPLRALIVVDAVAGRAALGRTLGATGALEAAGNVRGAVGGDGADLSYELTGNPDALNAALAATGREGRVIVGSFYGRKRGAIELGGHFHRGRIAIVSSQVSHISPALSGRWDRARRRDAAWDALARIDTRPLVTHRFPIGRAAQAFSLLDEGPTKVLQVLLTHE